MGEGRGCSHAALGAQKEEQKQEEREEGARSAEAKGATTPHHRRCGASRRVPRADWRTIPAPRPLRLPIGCCFPPSSRALPGATAPQPPQSSQRGMAAGGAVRGSEPGLPSVPGSAGDTSLLGSATVWPLKRYGRFIPPKDGDDEGQSTSWKVPAARGGWRGGVGLLALL